jgi:hypothetical protein
MMDEGEEGKGTSIMLPLTDPESFLSLWCIAGKKGVSSSARCNSVNMTETPAESEPGPLMANIGQRV